MQSIIDAIEQWLKDFLIGAITGNLSSMFSDVNSKVATIATEVGKDAGVLELQRLFHYSYAV